MKSTSDLERRITHLESRNLRVDSDKAWETSWTRRFAIMILTYITVSFYLQFVVHIDPWINALVPVIGYTLSTLTVARLKKYWLEKRNEGN